MDTTEEQSWTPGVMRFYIEPHSNFRLAPEEIFVQCPYDETHIIRDCKILMHVQHCRANYLRKLKSGDEPKIHICKFDAAHHVHAEEYDEHLLICPKRCFRTVSRPAAEAADTTTEEAPDEEEEHVPVGPMAPEMGSSYHNRSNTEVRRGKSPEGSPPKDIFALPKIQRKVSSNKFPVVRAIQREESPPYWSTGSSSTDRRDSEFSLSTTTSTWTETEQTLTTATETGGEEDVDDCEADDSDADTVVGDSW